MSIELHTISPQLAYDPGPRASGSWQRRTLTADAAAGPSIFHPSTSSTTSREAQHLPDPFTEDDEDKNTRFPTPSLNSARQSSLDIVAADPWEPTTQQQLELSRWSSLQREGSHEGRGLDRLPSPTIQQHPAQQLYPADKGINAWLFLLAALTTEL